MKHKFSNNGSMSNNKLDGYRVRRADLNGPSLFQELENQIDIIKKQAEANEENGLIAEAELCREYHKRLIEFKHRLDTARFKASPPNYMGIGDANILPVSLNSDGLGELERHGKVRRRWRFPSPQTFGAALRLASLCIALFTIAFLVMKLLSLEQLEFVGTGSTASATREGELAIVSAMPTLTLTCGTQPPFAVETGQIITLSETDIVVIETNIVSTAQNALNGVVQEVENERQKFSYTPEKVGPGVIVFTFILDENSRKMATKALPVNVVSEQQGACHP